MPTASGGHAATAGTKSAGTRIRSRTPHDVAGGRKPWWIRRAIQIAYGQTFRWKTRGRYDIYHEPNHVPVRSKLPTVTTIHDLSVIVHPEWHPADRVKWYESAFEAGLRQSRRFIAASEFTKREMVARLNIDPDKIDVTYQGPRDDFTPQSSTTIANVRQAMDLPEHFFLYVGTLEPRKNVEGLLDAFARLPADLRHEHPLLIAGAWGWKAEQLRTKIDAHKVAGEVRLLGYMHDRQLAALYSACTALVWPTFYEGFGLPPLEAMACGAPVIVSDVASLPEVVGNAGVKLPPDETQAWTEALERAANERSGADESAAERRRQSSLEQAALFSWQRCTSETIESYRRAIA
jgi:alpha-1,3-rhamnosyl/mannosyltransferase